MRQALRRLRLAQDVRLWLSQMKAYPSWRTEDEAELDKALAELATATEECLAMKAHIEAKRREAA